MRSDGAVTVAVAGTITVAAATMAEAAAAAGTGAGTAIVVAGTGRAIGRTGLIAGAAAMVGMDRSAGSSGVTGTGCESAADALTGGTSGARLSVVRAGMKTEFDRSR